MGKQLVAYFSASGVTALAAKKLAEAAKADLYEIRPEIPYTKDDLNWMNKKSRSSVEMGDRNIRPKLADHQAGIENYDTVFVGFPIWWYTAPTIINTFLESYDFSGKKVVLFATSGGSGFENALSDLRQSVPKNAEMTEGKVFSRRQSDKELHKWLETIL